MKLYILLFILLLLSCNKTNIYYFSYKVEGDALGYTITLSGRNNQSVYFLHELSGFEYWWLESEDNSRSFYIQASKNSSKGKVVVSLSIDHQIIAESKSDSIATISINY